MSFCFRQRRALLGLAVALALPAGLGAASESFKTDVQPLLQKYCYGCHSDEKQKADLNLQTFSGDILSEPNRLVWEKVMKNIRSGEMPPSNKPQPNMDEKEKIFAFIDREVFAADCTNPDPGRVTIRRLNRAEYNNTIRDLVGVDFKPAADFPSDDTGYGFDTIGDVLSVPPVLLEKYLAAAQKILDAAIVTEDFSKPKSRRVNGINMEAVAPTENLNRGGWVKVHREGDLVLKHQFPVTGDYKIKVRVAGQQAGPEPVKIAIKFEGKVLATHEVKAVQAKPVEFEVTVPATAGTKKAAVTYLNNYVKNDDPDPNNRDRNLLVQWMEITGPFNPKADTLPESHGRIFVCEPTHSNAVACAEKVIGNFGRRAFRRPLAKGELERLVKFSNRAMEDGYSFANGVKVALSAVLVSPHFLFRGELQPEPNNPTSVHFINEHALAARLSYFLWSSMPDTELFALAEAGKLRANMEKQVKRMLADPKAAALADNFAGQWLQTRNLMLMTPDEELFPEWDEELRLAMAKETELFFEHIMREDRPILDFIAADYTFVNERLAKHYGIQGVTGGEFKKVSLKGTKRAGVLTHGSVLTLTSNPTRTSPVKRGKWVLENLLGTPPPPAPPDVPDLEETKGKELTGTLRQRLEQHREDPTCASCHARMDPIGFGLENFNAIGGWRKVDGKAPIEPAGKLVSGEEFSGPDDLNKVLLSKKRDDFVRCISEKMLTYALGRGLEYYDKCALDQIAENLPKQKFKFSALVLEVIKSTPFQKRRGEAAQVVAN